MEIANNLLRSNSHEVQNNSNQFDLANILEKIGGGEGKKWAYFLS